MFIVSLIVIILISWANVDYFGTAKTNIFSPIVNQGVHLIAFFTTAAIGYINWRKQEKWVGYLWVGLYVLAIIVFLLSVTIHHFSGNMLVLRAGTGIRNRFTEPIVFLVFFLLLQLSSKLKNQVN
jgi:hypothetical protein